MISHSRHVRLLSSVSAALVFLVSALSATAQPPSVAMLEEMKRQGSEVLRASKALEDFTAESEAETVEISRMREEVDALVGEMLPLLDRFKAIQLKYVSDRDLDAVEKDRAEAAAALSRLGERVEMIAQEFKDVKSRLYMQRVAVKFAEMQANMMPKDAKKSLSDVMLLENYYREINGFRKDMVKVLAAEKNAYDAVKAENARKRVLGILASLAALLILLALAAMFYFGKRRAPPTGPITAYPATPTGALMGGAPALLAGPMSAPATGPVSGPVSGPAGPASGPAGPAAARLAEGAVLGENFRISRELGHGGMGQVYEATDLTLRRKVAIKRLKSEVTEDAKELEMFLAEARLVAALKHPNLVEIHSILREAGQLYLVFEHVEGKSLQEWLDETGKFPYRSVVSVVKQTAAALDYAHSKKVIHRDLKPSNVMITAEGAVKVMDFGIAHQAKKTVAKLTNAEAWGTPPYMSPEQEVGSVSRESDLYSLGVLYYEMLTGAAPFEGPNYLAQKREKIYRPPSERVGGLPPKVDAIVAKALAPEPKDRYHTGAEFSADAEAVLRAA